MAWAWGWLAAPVAGLALAGCVSTDCPATSQHVNGKCFASDAGHGARKAALDAGGSRGTGSAKRGSQDAAADASDGAGHVDGASADGGHAGTGGTDAGFADAGLQDTGPCGGAAHVACWKDLDGDGYAAASAKMMMQCGNACGAGWTDKEPQSGEADCDESDVSTYPGAAEACNGADDDCDTTVDENASSTCALDNATATCDQGVCKVASCALHYDDCDGKPGNGCEQLLNTATACGDCNVTCDARADCVETAHSGVACECHAPLFGDGSSCLGFGPLALGRNFVCGIRPGGGVECFGSGAPAQGSTELFSQLSAGYAHVCGIERNDARVITCWGDNANGQTKGGTVASPNGEAFVQVVSGQYHSCALLTGGSVFCWGGTGSVNQGQTLVPEDLQGSFKQLAAGASHTCGLKLDGSVACWGAGKIVGCSLATLCADEGQAVDQPTEQFIQITGGSFHTCGLRANGSVFCWGLGVNVVSGNGYAVGQSAPRNGPYQAIAAGALHTCGLTPQHKVECWGNAPSLDGSGNVLLVYAAADDLTCELYTNGKAQCFGVGASGTSSPPPTLDDKPWSLDP
jgi:hypothetical protein